MLTGGDGTGTGDVADRCKTGLILSICQADTVTKASIYVMVALGIVYFALTALILLLKLQKFKQLPYTTVQVGIVFYRLQVGQASGLLSHVLLHPI